ncbi:hypothetical protein Glove_166g274 [Diversispora epigaea]|uniref:Zinc-ribbon domain-containing protein n=1 Tax=Diversispora epigaea TaxID=1348612 RepID=A0A397IT83_9GLOM|nr:hypothetical protein Glove_166g274 [Diversispora epigaea]
MRIHCRKKYSKSLYEYTSCKNMRRTHCAGNTRLTLEDAKKIAFNRNGQCFSEKYVNSQSSLLWCCNKGHTWFAKLNHIKDGKAWCPYCSKYTRENLCREIISKYLGPPSKIRRLDFLKTLKHPRGLELDIPYYDYGFAIEIHGPQHEKYHIFFHKGDPNNFINGISSRMNCAKKTGLF